MVYMKCLLPVLLAVPITLIAATPPALPKPPQIPAGSQVATNRPTYKDLMKADSFTNSAGTVMVRINPSLWASK